MIAVSVALALLIVVEVEVAVVAVVLVLVCLLVVVVVAAAFAAAGGGIALALILKDSCTTQLKAVGEGCKSDPSSSAWQLVGSLCRNSNTKMTKPATESHKLNTDNVSQRTEPAIRKTTMS